MHQFRFILQFIPVILFFGLISTFFMPFYAAVSDGLEDPDFFMIRMMEDANGDYYNVYNGFHSVFAYCNVLASMLVLLNGRHTRMFVKLALGTFIITQLLVFLNPVMKAYVLTPPDKLLAGYKLMSLFSILFLTCTFFLTDPKKGLNK